jgi:hypothetical protein
MLRWMLVAALGLGGAAQAQEWDGRWLARFQGEGGGEREAAVEWAGATGSWRLYAKSSKDQRNPCIGARLPLRTREVSAGGLTLEVDGASLLPGCFTQTLVLRRAADGSLEGELHGAPLRLQRR